MCLPPASAYAVSWLDTNKSDPEAGWPLAEHGASVRKPHWETNGCWLMSTQADTSALPQSTISCVSAALAQPVKLTLAPIKFLFRHPWSAGNTSDKPPYYLTTPWHMKNKIYIKVLEVRAFIQLYWNSSLSILIVTNAASYSVRAGPDFSTKLAPSSLTPSDLTV